MAEPVIDKGIGREGLDFPGGNYEAVVDGDGWSEGGTKAGFVLRMFRKYNGGKSGGGRYLSIIAVCEGSRTLADCDVVLEREVGGDIQFEGHIGC